MVQLGSESRWRYLAATHNVLNRELEFQLPGHADRESSRTYSSHRENGKFRVCTCAVVRGKLLLYWTSPPTNYNPRCQFRANFLLQSHSVQTPTLVPIYANFGDSMTSFSHVLHWAPPSCFFSWTGKIIFKKYFLSRKRTHIQKSPLVTLLQA